MSFYETHLSTEDILARFEAQFNQEREQSAASPHRGWFVGHVSNGTVSIRYKNKGINLVTATISLEKSAKGTTYVDVQYIKPKYILDAALIVIASIVGYFITKQYLTSLMLVGIGLPTMYFIRMYMDKVSIKGIDKHIQETIEA